MKRMIAITVIALVSGFIAISIWKNTQNVPDLSTQKSSTLSMKRKLDIRRFWDVYRKASNLKRQGKWEKAVIAYQEALDIDSQHKDALYNLGNVFFELGEYNNAVTFWRKLTEVNPLSARAHIQLGSVYSCGAIGAPFNLEISEREFQRALSINKEQTGPILKLGEVHLLKGQTDLALTFFRTVLQSNSKSIEALYLTGYLHWKAGEQEAALTALRKTVKFSKAQPVPGTPLGEGDTRTEGAKPILADGAIRKSFYASRLTGLKAWEDKEISTRKMEQEYQKVNRMLKNRIGSEYE